MTFRLSVLTCFGLLLLFGNMLMVGYMILGLFKKTIQAPYVSSFNKDIFLMKEYLVLKSGLSLIDLGCGDGKAMRFFSNTYGVKCVGFDINFYAIVIGKFLTYFSPNKKQIQFFMKNFFSADLSQFDYIYVYLLPVQLASIESWIWEHKKEDTVIISNTFQFAQHTPFEIIDNQKGKKCIFLYK